MMRPSSRASVPSSTRRPIKASRRPNGGGSSKTDTDDNTTPQPSTRQTQQQRPLIPSGLSFVFRIDSLEPDFSVQDRLAYPWLGYWKPPTLRNAYTKTVGGLYRWRDGVITPAADVGITVPLYPFRTATVFSQEPQTPQLLAVEYDATAEDVLDNVKGEWQPLSFRQKGDYSYVDGHGDMSALPFPGSLTWMPQLLPVCYNCRDTNLAAAGLIGKLPLLISLVAFSCPPTTLYLDYVLTNHVFPGMWYPHDGLTGRVPERGLVVSTFYDPAPSVQITPQHLLNLEDGEYGPIFAP